MLESLSCVGFTAFLPRLGLSAGSLELSAETGGVVDGVMLASFCSFASACPLAVSSGSTVLSVLGVLTSCLELSGAEALACGSLLVKSMRFVSAASAVYAS